MPGPIQIKRPDVVGDIRLLADLTGLPLTEAVAKAVRGQLAIERVRADARLARKLAAAERGLAEIRKLPVTGPLLTDDDLYDRDGLPL